MGGLIKLVIKASVHRVVALRLYAPGARPSGRINNRTVFVKSTLASLRSLIRQKCRAPARLPSEQCQDAPFAPPRLCASALNPPAHRLVPPKHLRRRLINPLHHFSPFSPIIRRHENWAVPRNLRAALSFGFAR